MLGPDFTHIYHVHNTLYRDHMKQVSFRWLEYVGRLVSDTNFHQQSDRVT